jgi:hypothetical protein
MKNWIRFALLCFMTPALQACSDKDVLKGNCVKVEYVGISDSYCGGPDK